MLLPWSKPSTLSICHQGIAFKQANAKSQLLSDANFNWQNATQLAEVLTAQESLLAHQQINVVISNTLVRYLILPWQDEVFAKNDWQSIAQHAFRKQYGAIADNWRVSVSLGEYGQSIIAVAVDESLYLQLEASAKALNFSLLSIQPLLMTILNITEKVERDWILIAEPERILLCRAYAKQWQQIAIDSPLSGMEFQQAEQIINRNLIQVTNSERPNNVFSFASTALNKSWETNSKLQKMMLRNPITQAHALWIAELPVNQSRQNTDLDFTEKTKLTPTTKAWGLMGIALLATGVLYTQYLHTSAQIKHTQDLVNAKMAVRPYVIVAKDSQDTLKLAQRTQQALDLPWIQMLQALEAIKKENPNIAILSISPNKNRGEIKLTGQTANFTDLTHFLDALRTNENFNDAALVSQHLADEQAKLLYVFEINLGWHV